MLCGPRTWHGVLVVLAGVSALGGVQNGGFEVTNTPEEFPPWQNDGALIYPDAQLPNPMFCYPEPIVAPDGSSRFAGKVANYDNVDFWLGQIVDVYAPGGETLAVSLNAYYYLSSHQNETGHDEGNVRLYWEMGYKSDGSDPADMYDADTWMYLLPPPHYVDGTLTQAGGTLCEAHWELLSAEPITWQIPVTLCPPKVILRVHGLSYWPNMWNFVLLDGVQFSASGEGCDFDEDGDVDLYDWTTLGGCYSGPGGGIPSEPPDCWKCDLDSDADVDLIDLATFQMMYSGP